MTLIIPTGYVQATLPFQSSDFSNGTAFVTVGLANTGGKSLADVAAAVADVYDDTLKFHLSTSVRLGNIIVIDGESRHEGSPLVVGTNTQAMPPPNVALLVNLRSGLRTPRGRGRNYWPHHLEEPLIDARGRIASGAYTSLQSSFFNFYQGLRGEDLNPVVLQRDTPEQKSPPLATPPVVSVTSLSALVATQRRRLR